MPHVVVYAYHTSPTHRGSNPREFARHFLPRIFARGVLICACPPHPHLTKALPSPPSKQLRVIAKFFKVPGMCHLEGVHGRLGIAITWDKPRSCVSLMSIAVSTTYLENAGGSDHRQCSPVVCRLSKGISLSLSSRERDRQGRPWFGITRTSFAPPPPSCQSRTGALRRVNTSASIGMHMPLGRQQRLGGTCTM